MKTEGLARESAAFFLRHFAQVGGGAPGPGLLAGRRRQLRLAETGFGGPAWVWRKTL